MIAIAEKGSLLYAPDVYMEKIAIGPGYPANTVALDASATDNMHAVARAKGVPVNQVTACILDRPRHARMIEEMARGDVLFAATGVTDGNLLQGVRFTPDAIITHTIVMRSSSRTVREIKARHQDLAKFD